METSESRLIPVILEASCSRGPPISRVSRTAPSARPPKMNWPAPKAAPMRAHDQRLAAVVSPWIFWELRSRMMTPAPKNPSPVIRPYNTRLIAWALSWSKSPISITAVAEPMATRLWVRMPADLWCSHRLRPRTVPTRRARARRIAMLQYSSQWSIFPPYWGFIPLDMFITLRR